MARTAGQRGSLQRITEAGSNTPSKWRLRVTVGYDDAGRPQQVSQMFTGSEDAARKELRKFINRHPGQSEVLSTTKVDALLDRWLEWVPHQDWSPTTMADSIRIVERDIRPALGHIRLNKLTAHDLDVLDAERSDAGNAPGTRIKLHTLISGILKQGVRWDMIKSNPATNATVPKRRYTEPKVPSPAEVEAIINEVRRRGRPLLADLYLVAALIGARRGEMCGLKFGDWDNEAQTLRIERSVYVRKGDPSWGIKSTKTHAARVVILDGAATDALTRCWEAAHDLADEDGVDFANCFIFTGTQAPPKPDTVGETFKKASDEVGVDCHLHSLRHWSATQMVAHGVPITVVAKRLGHADSHTTLKVYAHALPGQDAAAAALLGGLLSTHQQPEITTNS